MESRIEIRPGRTINVTHFQNPQAEQTIFLIHGLGGRSEQFRAQLDLLKKNYSLILPDLYGQGKSDKPEPVNTNPYSFVEISRDLDALFTRYAGKSNIIIGHSYGGAFAAALGFNQQERVDKLILLSATPCMTNIPIPGVYKLPVVILNIIKPLLEKQFIKLAFYKTQDHALIEKEMLASRENKMYVIKGLISGMQTIPKIDFSRLTKPALLLTGNNDKLIIPPVSEHFYRILPNITMNGIKNASHLVMLEQPAEVNNAINQFLGQ